jgi:hypothetical protein
MFKLVGQSLKNVIFISHTPQQTPEQKRETNKRRFCQVHEYVLDGYHRFMKSWE